MFKEPRLQYTIKARQRTFVAGLVNRQVVAVLASAGTVTTRLPRGRGCASVGQLMALYEMVPLSALPAGIEKTDEETTLLAAVTVGFALPLMRALPLRKVSSVSKLLRNCRPVAVAAPMFVMVTCCVIRCPPVTVVCVGGVEERGKLCIKKTQWLSTDMQRGKHRVRRPPS